ncbi:MAG: SagB/ThcOx family dehydrogenase [Deltaproteobacteria bacterium]|nr:SagB/ThcOx family dehydrogenase [Deltaproteobacteria bacterium]
MDWANQPDVFKHYPGIDPVFLPKEVQAPGLTLSSVLCGIETDAVPKALNCEDLALILFLTHSFTAKARHPEGDFYYRSAASAGALYPTEVYVATHGVEGLGDGLYHFALHHHALVPLRSHDPASWIEGICRAPGRALPILTFALTAIFFRSAWKYRDRSYRYHLMDTGHVLENLVLALKALGLAFRISFDFDDHALSRLVGLDEEREAALAVVHVHGSESPAPPEDSLMRDLPPSIRAASRVSGREMDYPLIREIHLAGITHPDPRGEEPDMLRMIGPSPEGWQKVNTPLSWPETMDYPEALFRRRSRRNYIEKPVERESTMALLDSLCGVGEGEDPYPQAVSVGLLAGNAETLEPGLYLLDRARRTIGMAIPGQFTEWMARVCLDQMWLAHAGLHFLFLANVEVLDLTWGPRGYRYAMMSAGRMGQRLYLAATALGLGCCGIGAFYDWEAADLLKLNRSSRLLYLVAVGKVKRG